MMIFVTKVYLVSFNVIYEDLAKDGIHERKLFQHEEEANAYYEYLKKKANDFFKKRKKDYKNEIETENRKQFYVSSKKSDWIINLEPLDLKLENGVGLAEKFA